VVPVSEQDGSGSDTGESGSDDSVDQQTGVGGDQARPDALSGPGSLAQLVSELPPAPIGVDSLAPADATNAPITVSVGSIGIAEAAVIPVGVEPDGRMEVPPADLVGWYRFGSVPGEQGQTVLAAHVAYDGVDGVFVDLVEVAIGDEVTVSDGSGGVSRYRVVSNDQYDKDELPDQLFARTGEPGLVLITCGGIFDSSARSYEDNIVVVAVPLD
jgi:LPXTG-site transpeptidase (sortase) family protein